MNNLWFKLPSGDGPIDGPDYDLPAPRFYEGQVLDVPHPNYPGRFYKCRVLELYYSYPWTEPGLLGIWGYLLESVEFPCNRVFMHF